MVHSKKRAGSAGPAIPEESTRAGVFIIESLDFEDEQKQRFEGRILKDMLVLSGKEVEYWYVRTWKELTDDIFQRFYDSKLRYLHLSCHGSATHVSLTLDDISFHEFGAEICNYLEKRRPMTSDVPARSSAAKLLRRCRLSASSVRWR